MTLKVIKLGTTKTIGEALINGTTIAKLFDGSKRPGTPRRFNGYKMFCYEDKVYTFKVEKGQKEYSQTIEFLYDR